MQSEILKYHRIEESLTATLGSDKITAGSIELNSIVLGTEDGYVHVMSFSGNLVKSTKVHDRPVNSISVDSSGHTVASCSDNGTVVVSTLGLGAEDKDTVIHFNQSMKAVCIENDSATKKDKSFLVGSVTGQLIYHRTVWFSQKNVVLFNGADSAVTTIAWRGDIVAWADSTQVRIMDLATQTAICFLNCPQGVSTYNPLPCCLFWESERDLLIGWADSVRQIELSSTQGPNGAEVITARSVVDWETDFIVCGISSFDADHVVVLGFTPPSEEELGPVIIENYPDTKNHISALSGMNENEIKIGLNQLEIQILLRTSGEIISSDVLVLDNETMGGPNSFRLLSTYNCLSHGRDAQKWRLTDVRENCPRGGMRGLAPTLFIISPSEFIAARVRDVNDYIKQALDNTDLKSAVEYAMKDKLSLRVYRYADLVTLYIEDLLDKDRPSDLIGIGIKSSSGNGNNAPNGESRNASRSGSVDIEYDADSLTNNDNYNKHNMNKNNDNSQNNKISDKNDRNENEDQYPYKNGPRTLSAKDNYLLALTRSRNNRTNYSALAASECKRLIGCDAVLWERWTYAFAARKCLHFISPYLPCINPRLPNTVYEVVIDNFLYSNSKAFLDVVRRWSPVCPPLFNHRVLLERLRTKNSHFSAVNSATVGKENLRVQRWDLVEAQAQLHIISKEHEEALNCYLEMNTSYTKGNNDIEELENNKMIEIGDFESKNNNGEDNSSGSYGNSQTKYGKVREQTYRHVFELIEREGMYGIVRDKIVQLAHLSREHSARLLVKHIDKLPPCLVVEQLTQEPLLLHWYLHTLFTRIPERYNTQQEFAEYHLMQIPLHARFAPSFKRQEKTEIKKYNDYSLSNKSRKNVDLDPFLESTSPSSSSSAKNSKSVDSDFLHFLKNSAFVVLEIALRECEKRKPPLFPEMIYILGKLGKTKDALSLLLREVQDVKIAIDFVERHDKALWEDLIEHSLKQAALGNSSFLGSLLDHLGTCGLDPVTLISQIEGNTEIPELRSRLLKIIHQNNFEVSLHGICNSSLEDDTITILRSLNQGRRKAIKVEPTVRCVGCSRPLFMSPPTAPMRNTAHFTDSTNSSKDSNDVKNNLAVKKSGNSTTLSGAEKSNFNDDTIGKIWGKPEVGFGQSGLVVYQNKQVYHTSCFEKIRK